MTNRKTTKRALLGSVLALILCFTMLLGSTYAWFTDTDYVAVNSIKSGILDIELLDKDGNSLVGKTLNFFDIDGDPDYADPSELLWEPGATYVLPEVQIKNAGNLALKYHLTINGVVGDAKLLEAIEWTIKIGNTSISADDGTILNGGVVQDNVLLPGEVSSMITIQAHMKEEAGNEYQNLTLSGLGITVLATQVPYENDSFGPDYDQNAEYPTAPVLVNTFAELQYAIDNGQPAKLNADLIPEKGNPKTEVIIEEGQVVVIDLNGHKLGAAEQGQYFGSNWSPIGQNGKPKTHYAIDNYGTLTIVGGGTEGDVIEARGVQNFGTMTVEAGVTIKAKDENAGAAIWNEGDLIVNGAVLEAAATTLAAPAGATCISNQGGNVEINGATVTCKSGAYAIVNGSGNMVINDVTIVDARGGIACNGGTIVINDADVTVNGNTSGWAVYASAGTITINGGTFVNTGAADRLYCTEGTGVIIDNR